MPSPTLTAPVTDTSTRCGSTRFATQKSQSGIGTACVIRPHSPRCPAETSNSITASHMMMTAHSSSALSKHQEVNIYTQFGESAQTRHPCQQSFLSRRQGVTQTTKGFGASDQMRSALTQLGKAPGFLSSAARLETSALEITYARSFLAGLPSVLRFEDVLLICIALA